MELRTALFLTAVHNRYEQTLNCIEKIYSSEMHGLKPVVVVVDDGSTDSTAEKLVCEFPQVIVVSGNGSLFWAGGMRFGLKYVEEHFAFDILVAFNNDVVFSVDAIERLVRTFFELKSASNGRGIGLAASFQSTNGKLTYGGYRLRRPKRLLGFKRVNPDHIRALPIDACNFNTFLVDKICLDENGFLAEIFTHQTADIEYSLRIRTSKKSDLYLAPGVYGVCNRNTIVAKDDSLSQRFIKVCAYVRSPKVASLRQVYFLCRHAGPLFSSLAFLNLNIRRYLAYISVIVKIDSVE